MKGCGGMSISAGTIPGNGVVPAQEVAVFVVDGVSGVRQQGGLDSQGVSWVGYAAFSVPVDCSSARVGDGVDEGLVVVLVLGLLGVVAAFCSLADCLR